jgi:hypothetical protein
MVRVRENVEALRERLPAPLVALFPYQAKENVEDLARLLNIEALV